MGEHDGVDVGEWQATAWQSHDREEAEGWLEKIASDLENNTTEILKLTKVTKNITRVRLIEILEEIRIR